MMIAPWRGRSAGECCLVGSGNRNNNYEVAHLVSSSITAMLSWAQEATSVHGSVVVRVRAGRRRRPSRLPPRRPLHRLPPSPPRRGREGTPPVNRYGGSAAATVADRRFGPHPAAILSPPPVRRGEGGGGGYGAWPGPMQGRRNLQLPPPPPPPQYWQHGRVAGIYPHDGGLADGAPARFYHPGGDKHQRTGHAPHRREQQPPLW